MTYLKIDHYIIALEGLRGINHLGVCVLIAYTDKTEMTLEFATEETSLKAFNELADALGAI